MDRVRLGQLPRAEERCPALMGQETGTGQRGWCGGFAARDDSTPVVETNAPQGYVGRFIHPSAGSRNDGAFPTATTTKFRPGRSHETRGGPGRHPGGVHASCAASERGATVTVV